MAPNWHYNYVTADMFSVFILISLIEASVQVEMAAWDWLNNL